MAKVLILGGGFGGVVAAKRLAEELNLRADLSNKWRAEGSKGLLQ